jgi:NAD(P)H-nitrite reductase large subunit
VQKNDLFHDYADRFTEKDIHLRLSQKVVSIDLKENTVHLAHREHLQYDRLLIATGVRTAIRSSYKPFAEYLTCVNSLDDVEKLKHREATLEHPLILGGSLTAIRLAVALRTMEKPVDYLLFKKMTGSLLAGADDFNRVKELLLDNGVNVFEDMDVEAVVGTEEAIRVSFSNGVKRTYTRLFAGFGVTPNAELARKANIACDQGVLVNEYFETNRAGIFAAGDVAQIYNPKLMDYWVNFGWPNAVKQGALAGQNMADVKKAYQPARANILALGGKEIMFRDWQ